MNNDVLARAYRLSDSDLLAEVQALAHQEREVTVALIAHLVVLEERLLHLAEGYRSLFSYCTGALHLSEHAAFGRIEAARAVRRFPVLLEMLSDGSLTLTTLCLLAPHLTPADHDALLTAARHKSKRQVEALIAQLHPLPSVPPIIRRLPSPAGVIFPPAPGGPHPPAPTLNPIDSGYGSEPNEDADGPAGAAVQSSRHTAGILVEPTNDLSVPPPPRPALIAPLGLKRYRVQFTAGAEFCDKLKLAQDLLRHQIPDGDVAEIMDRALTLLVDAVAREKFAATERPRGARADQDGVPGSLTRHIPAEVKRAVWLRDGGRCAYVARGGRRCDARGFLEFHHVVPYAEGGEATVENIELRCRSHNHHEAALRFGEMDSSAPYRDTPPRALPTAARTRMISSARAGPG